MSGIIFLVNVRIVCILFYPEVLTIFRTLRVYSLATKNPISQCSKTVLPGSKDISNFSTRIFHDDTLKTYFRRLCFSPDGLLLITPSGVIEPPPSSVASDGNVVEIPVKPVNTSYVFLRDSFTEYDCFKYELDS